MSIPTLLQSVKGGVHKNRVLAQSVRATLYYFSLSEMPLTAQEVWRNLWCRDATSFAEVVDCLDACVSAGEVVFYRGMYMCIGRQQDVETRRIRYVISEKKIQRARRIVRILALIPFVRMIALANSLSWSNAHEESDIDLFIVAHPGCVAFVRLMCVGLAQLCGWRTHAKSPLCLTFFVGADALDLSRVALTDESEMDDVYLHYWIAQLTPLYDEHTMYDNFFQQNAWIEKYLPNRIRRKTSHMRRVTVHVCARMSKRMLERVLFPFLPFLETWALQYQRSILPTELLRLLNVDTRVMMNEHVMKFHATDRRAEIREAFIKYLTRDV